MAALFPFLIRRLAAQPAFWLVAAGLASGSWLWGRAAGSGLTSFSAHGSNTWTLLYLALIGGVALGLSAWDGLAPLLPGHTSTSRAVAVLLLTTTPALLFAAVVLVSDAVRTGEPPGVGPGVRILLAVLHAAALGSVVARFPLEPGHRSILFVGLAWVAPASVPAGSALAAACDFSQLFDGGGGGGVVGRIQALGPALARAAASIIALLALGTAYEKAASPDS